ncbi:hypothetical protein DACRYDRAFT_118718 [Dacryopinax primogenitus]|uniref:Arrestin C-terminal-like domain-containing protein n=1 Tax=Dacryopinax primogenitus (strain DJM 731) TaxID=1858805 RepID=M5G3V4_DACPD|nr:uncharacterized protein DACRYDRAFT_118718 [Dacryopinax primogenitus]EJT98442.1 hypothetical protein DACRYDRAFT_118718 [Dacryopinax primogenitus]
MSQIKIIVRQPPNRDFLEGFPGIPPNAPERPNAALRGTVELRVQGGTPVKAKWVQIELKKIETLLQGQGEPYVETIGHAPRIWQANGEYENLQVRDFPFYIQIPMNVPPSIALEKGSGIRYEMVASLCVKGKKGILRKDKNNVTSTSVPIVMDKHELHTLWPVYHRPQTSTATNDGLNLIVTRDASCYGPGDSVTARVELRSGRLSPCILRAWEMTLREHVIFRPDPSQLTHSKQAPVAGGQQYRHNVIAEQKKSLSKTIYEGVTVQDELACLIPIQHRTATTQGRLIEVQFTLSVKAVMESAGSVEVMMPVLMSHWSKEMSENSLRKIGPVPHLGIQFPPVPTAAAQPSQGYNQPQSYTQSHSNGSMQTLPQEVQPMRPQIAKNELPNPDDVGPPSPPYTPPEMGSHFTSQQANGRTANGRPRESTLNSRSRTLAVVNIDPNENGASPSPAVSSVPPSQPYKASWESAEIEKKRLKEAYSQEQGQSSSSSQQPIVTTTPSTPAVKPNFSSAEDEKERLYRRAQAQARRTQDLARKEQGLPPSVGSPSLSAISNQTSASASASGSTSNSSALRSPKVAPITAVASSATPLTPPATSSKAPSIRSESVTPGASPPPGSNWASAEAEKERLYRIAQRRARETQARVASATPAGGSASSPTPRQSIVQTPAASRPTSTFKLNNPDSPEDGPIQSGSSALTPARAASASPAPAPSITPGGTSAATAAQAMYAQAMAARQSPASGSRQSVGYTAASPQPTHGHTPRPSQASSTSYSQGSGSSLPPAYATGGSSGAGPGWSNAEDEKAQLSRYYEAKHAVSRKAEGGDIGEPMGAGGGSSSAYIHAHSASSLPLSQMTSPALAPQPIHQASPSPVGHYASSAPTRMNSVASVRKEQTPSPVYNRTHPQHTPTPSAGYGAPQDYFTQQRPYTPQQTAPGPSAFSPGSRASGVPLPVDEKERMKLFFEAQDAARRYQETQGASGSGGSGMNNSPPHAGPMASSSSYPSPPVTVGPPGYEDAPPAIDGGSSRSMSALEEKARLAREYQQQQQVAQGQLSRNPSIQSVRTPGPPQMPQYGAPPMLSPSYSNSGLPSITTQYGTTPLQRNNSSYKFIPSPIEEEPSGPPPPLLPRPPQAYIEQTIQEEAPADVAAEHGRPAVEKQQSWKNQPLNFRPMSPFNVPLPNAQNQPLVQGHWEQPPPTQQQYAQPQYQQAQPPYYR